MRLLLIILATVLLTESVSFSYLAMKEQTDVQLLQFTEQNGHEEEPAETETTKTEKNCFPSDHLFATSISGKTFYPLAQLPGYPITIKKITSPPPEA